MTRTFCPPPGPQSSSLPLISVHEREHERPDRRRLQAGREAEPLHGVRSERADQAFGQGDAIAGIGEANRVAGEEPVAEGFESGEAELDGAGEPGLWGARDVEAGEPDGFEPGGGVGLVEQAADGQGVAVDGEGLSVHGLERACRRGSGRACRAAGHRRPLYSGGPSHDRDRANRPPVRGWKFTLTRLCASTSSDPCDGDQEEIACASAPPTPLDRETRW